jgi:dynein heavy chain, axonemal
MKMKNSLESIVIKWANQIGEVLKEQSAGLFKDNRHPTPREEYEFWEARMRNLENIYTQLRDPRVKQVGRVLELIDSCYFPSFHATFKNVVAALHEAQDVILYLKPLVSTHA